MLANHLVELLRRSNDRLVLAESCTGGQVASLITQISGVSDCFCGSFVTYLDQVKVDWLGVDKLSIDRFSAVSSEVARQMVEGALNRTGEATLAAAITGHLGPGAPVELDGTVFLSIAFRTSSSPQFKVVQCSLRGKERIERKNEATTALLEFVCAELEAKRASA